MRFSELNQPIGSSLDIYDAFAEVISTADEFFDKEKTEIGHLIIDIKPIHYYNGG